MNWFIRKALDNIVGAFNRWNDDAFVGPFTHIRQSDFHVSHAFLVPMKYFV